MNITSILFSLALVTAAQAAPTDTSMGNGAWLADSAVQPNGHIGWTGCYSSAPPPTGCFIQFLGYDSAGTLISAVTLNGGVMVAGASGSPQLQGDLDVVVVINGKPVTVAFAGSWQGSQPGLITNPPGVMWLGNQQNYWGGLWLQTFKSCPSGLPGTPCGCVHVSGGWVPLYACGQ